jgi:hypothetical protein
MRPKRENVLEVIAVSQLPFYPIIEIVVKITIKSNKISGLLENNTVKQKRLSDFLRATDI